MPVFMIDRKSGERFALDKAIVLIGRHPDCDVVLTENPKVSRRHCCVAQVNDTFIIRDLGSMNGVRVNGELIRKEAKLKQGDEFVVGDVRFFLEFVDQPEKSRNFLPEEKGIEQALDKVAENPEKKNGSDSSAPALGKPPSHSKKPNRNLNLSQSIPIALEEEDKDFAVEEHSLEKSSYGLEPEKQNNDSLSDVVIIDEIENEDPDDADNPPE